MKGLGKLCARRLELGTVSAEPMFAHVLVAKLRPLGETVGLYARAYFWQSRQRYSQADRATHGERGTNRNATGHENAISHPPREVELG
jgi:hypothetical protein